MSTERRNPVSDFEDDDQSPNQPAPTLVSLHFIRTTLRQRLVACLLAALLGLAAAATYMVAFPTNQAKASLFLTHNPDVSSSDAMTTDVSLMTTQTVAARTTSSLGLAMSPEDFLKGIKFNPVSSEVIALTLSAPSEAEAVRRLDGFTATYLKFRAEQLSLQSQILVDGMQQRIAKLQQDVEDLSRRIDKLSAADGTDTSQLSDAVSQRAYLQGQIESLQQSVEDVTLTNSSVVASSRILDSPAPEPGLAKRGVVLGLATGLIGGAALGCGTVLFLAITSDRLRRRSDVAAALGVNVPISVGRVAPLSTVLRWIPPLAAVDHRRANDRQRLAQAIEVELLTRPPARLVVAGLDNTDELGFAVAEVAGNLAARDYPITAIDLTEDGSRGISNAVCATETLGQPTVLRPRGLPALARGNTDLLIAGQWHDGDSAAQPPLADFVLVLADLDPTVGVDHLAAWADRVILVVTAGRSSVEKVRTVGEMVRAAGLDLRFAALLHTERTDESSGLGTEDLPAVTLREDDDALGLTGATEAR